MAKRVMWALPVTASAFAMPLGNAALGAEYQGGVITREILPAEVTAALPTATTGKEFKLRLRERGSVILDGTTLEIGELSAEKKVLTFMALDSLVLKNGASIVTNGNPLVLFVNELKSDRGKIRALNPDATVAAAGAHATGAGQPGKPGQSGASGGSVTIYVVDKLTGHLSVDLGGQTGGAGGMGSVGGGGPEGGRGRDAKGTLKVGFLGAFCENGAGKGGTGGQGFAGGPGGVGGAGGDGGLFQLFNVGSSPIDHSSYDFKSKGGAAGAPGTGAVGGPGGIGGHGGSGHPACDLNAGGESGDQGPQGVSGETPSAKVKKGADGNVIVKNLDLEVVARRAVGQQASR